MRAAATSSLLILCGCLGCYVEPYTPPPQQAQAQPAQPPPQQQPGYAEQPPPPPPASSWQGTPTTPPPRWRSRAAAARVELARDADDAAAGTAARVELAGGADDAAPRSDVQRPDLRRRQRRGRGQQRPVD